MFVTALVVLATFCILLGAEYISRTTTIRAELTRKLVHVAVGTFVAFWPFFIGWQTIQLLSLAFFIVVCISIRLRVFRSIHSVERSVIGELLFAVVIGVLATITTNEWIFMAAMLHLSVADGIAAVVGVSWGQATSYKVLGSTKSIVGTASFVVVSFAILSVYAWFAPGTISLPTLLLLPFAAAAAENLAIYSTDNLVMPLLVAVVLAGGL